MALAAGTAGWLAAPWRAGAFPAGAVTWRLEAAPGERVTAVRAPDGASLAFTTAGEGARVTGTYDPGLYRVETARGEDPALAFTVGMDAGETDLRPAVLPPAVETGDGGTTRTSVREAVVCVALALVALEGVLRTLGARRTTAG